MIQRFPRSFVIWARSGAGRIYILPGIIAGARRGVLLFGEESPGVAGVLVVPGNVTGVFAPGYEVLGGVELSAPGVPGAVWPRMKELSPIPSAGISKNAALFFILTTPARLNADAAPV